jgi:prophage DNA circulation protein
MSEIWKARLLPGSFRGIPFYIESHELTGGRHIKQHEPPDRNSGFSEDIGKKTPGFRINCHVVGDNYFFLRDLLVNAMESGLTGVLIHPYLGIKLVKAEGYTLSETTEQGRMASFQLSFKEAGSSFPPFALIDAIVDLATTIVGLIAVVQTAFVLAYKIAELPGFARESADALIADFGNTILEGFKNVRLDGTQHAETKRKTERLKANSEEYANNSDPTALFIAVEDIIDDLKDLVPDAPDSFTVDSASGRDDQLAVFKNLLAFDGGSALVAALTPTRTIEKANLVALENLIQQIAIAKLAQKVASKQWQTNDEASAARLEVTEAIEAQLSKIGLPDDLFQALEDLNAKLVRAVPNTSSTTYNIKEITLNETYPSIVIAYDLYESAANEQDIIRRNKIRNPGFVSGRLKVLTEAR